MGSKSPKSLSTYRHILDRTAHRVTHHGVSITTRLVLGLLFLIALGTGLLMLPGIGANGRLTFNEAVFTATSALTVTGLSIITPATDLTLLGKGLLLIMIQIGGVGFMFIAVILLRLIGRRIFIDDRLALADSLGLDSPAKIMRLLTQVFAGVLLIEAVGAIVLWLRWMAYFRPAKALGYAIFHSISAFCNAGFDLFNGSQTKDGVPFDGIPTDMVSLATFSIIILIGGLGIPVIAELLNYRRQRKLTVNARVTLWVVVILTLGGWFAIFLSEGMGTGVVADEPLAVRMMRTFFQSVSNRTAGFAGLPEFGRLAPSTLIIIMGMMFIGCAPASMGGGITTGTFSVLMLSWFGYVSGQMKPTIWKRSIDARTVQRAGTILTISLGLLLFSTWIILLTHPHLSLNEVLFEVVSAFATCGLSLGVTGEFNWFGRMILMILMFWGRLGPLSVIIAVAQRRNNTRHLVRYPEDQILIG